MKYKRLNVDCNVLRFKIVIIINCLPLSSAEDLHSFVDTSLMESEGTANANILRQYFEEQSLNSVTPPTTGEYGQSIIIVGAGAFGSSLALELVTNYRDKYCLRWKTVLIIDTSPSMSSISGLCLRETLLRQIPLKSYEQIT
jgi:hypothetical protein